MTAALDAMVKATMDLAPEGAALVPPGRAKLRMTEGRVSMDFTVRYRRRLSSGMVRLYVEA